GTTATGTSTGNDYTGTNPCIGSILVQFRKTTFTAPAAVDAIMDNGSGILATTPISATSVAVRSFATGFITAGRPSDQDATQRTSIINWVRGQDNKDDENVNSSFTDIRASVHGDVLHSRPAVVNYNRFGGDKVYLYAGFHRGGQLLYGFDVTDPATPKLLWRKTNADAGYSELGQTWSSPTVTKLAASIGNASNPENVVLIFGAGYDSNVDDVNPCLLQSVGPNSVTLKPVGSGTVDYSAPVGSCTINNPTGGTTTRTRTIGRGVLIV